jgi:hypothetical protein
MHDAGKGVHRFAVDQHVQLDHVRGLVAGVLVIHRAEAAGDALDAVVEVNQNFRSGSVLVSMTRRGSSVSVWSATPRFSASNAIMSPMYSLGQMTKAQTIGSSIFSM